MKTVYRNGGLALAFFVLTLVFSILVAARMQMAWGLYGVAATELAILGIALLGALTLRRPLSHIFRFRWPRFKQVRGSFFVYCGSYAVTMAVSFLSLYIFPEMQDLSRALSDVFTSQTFFVSAVIVALMPAFCEEFLHRGFLLTALSDIKSTAARVFLMGILFGLFHLDPYRFLPTMILGMSLTYIMIKTDTLLLPISFHLLNNLFGVSIAFGYQEQPPSEILAEGFVLTLPMATGYIFFFLGIAVLFLPFGFRALNEVPKKVGRVKTVITVLLGIALSIGGLAIAAASLS